MATQSANQQPASQQPASQQSGTQQSGTQQSGTQQSGSQGTAGSGFNPQGGIPGAPLPPNGIAGAPMGGGQQGASFGGSGGSGGPNPGNNVGGSGGATGGTPVGTPSVAVSPPANGGGTAHTLLIGGAVLLAVLAIAALVMAWRVRRSEVLSVRSPDGDARRGIDTMIGVGRRISALRDPGDVEQSVVREAIALAGADAGGLVRFSPAGNLLVYESADGIFDPSYLDAGMLGASAYTGQPIVQSGSPEPWFRNVSAAFAAVPLTCAGKVDEVLVLVRPPDMPFGHGDIESLRLFAPVAAAALVGARRVEEVDNPPSVYGFT